MYAPDGNETNRLHTYADKEGKTEVFPLLFTDEYGTYTVEATSWDAAGNKSEAGVHEFERIEPTPTPVVMVDTDGDGIPDSGFGSSNSDSLLVEIDGDIFIAIALFSLERDILLPVQALQAQFREDMASIDFWYVVHFTKGLIIATVKNVIDTVILAYELVTDGDSLMADMHEMLDTISGSPEVLAYLFTDEIDSLSSAGKYERAEHLGAMSSDFVVEAAMLVTTKGRANAARAGMNGLKESAETAALVLKVTDKVNDFRKTLDRLLPDELYNKIGHLVKKQGDQVGFYASDLKNLDDTELDELLQKTVTDARERERIKDLLENRGKSFPKNMQAFRNGLKQIDLSWQSMDNPQAHHVFPKKFEKFFDSAGIDIWDPKYGSWWDATKGVPGNHPSMSSSYNYRWQEYFISNPDTTTLEVLNYGRKLSQEYGFKLNY